MATCSMYKLVLFLRFHILCTIFYTVKSDYAYKRFKKKERKKTFPNSFTTTKIVCESELPTTTYQMERF